ncbi:MAG: YdcH family protein [Acidobacteria bacterium]|nr:YdcH family protein [Acidobacteriota bacterium]
MELADPQVRSILLDASDEFRGLVEEHAGFESRLEELTGKHLPNEQDRIEKIQLKKHKLILKDQMAALIRDYREKLVVAH